LRVLEEPAGSCLDSGQEKNERHCQPGNPADVSQQALILSFGEHGKGAVGMTESATEDWLVGMAF